MNLQKPYVSFLLRSHLFIALCAACLSAETAVMLKQPFQPFSLYTFIFSSTLFTYNIYYFYSKRFLFHRLLAFAGLTGSIISLFFMDEVPIILLSLVAILASLYLLPIFIPFRKPATFTLQKLFILIIVWVIITFLIPKEEVELNLNYFLLLLYRIVFISLLCLLFFIRDEMNLKLKKKAMLSAYILGIIQMILSMIIIFQCDLGIGLIFSAISLLGLLVSHMFNTKPKTDLEYLFFVDGIMLLQSIFVLFKFSISP